MSIKQKFSFCFIKIRLTHRAVYNTMTYTSWEPYLEELIINVKTYGKSTLIQDFKRS